MAQYHETCLDELLEHAREGFARYDAGELDTFELDDLIRARELWKFCVVTGSGIETAAWLIQDMRERGELPDWLGGRAPAPAWLSNALSCAAAARKRYVQSSASLRESANAIGTAG